MHPKSPRWLEDIANASAFTLEVAVDYTLAESEKSRLLRSAVERNFEIIGEALLRLENTDPETAGRISDYRKIIGFRNRLAHGYDQIDHRQVWRIIQQSLPVLHEEVRAILTEVDEESVSSDQS
jgi:uncharacterized protein with HEPN domain